MDIGVLREIKEGEGRVGITPEGAHALVQAGHRVVVEKGAGVEAGYTDEAYQKAGAKMAHSPEEVYASSFIVKVKEPQPEEERYLRTGQILFCYLHLAANVRLERFLKERGVLAVAYETVTDSTGGLPCLAPMSAMAGKIAVQEGAHFLGAPLGGKGVLIGSGRVLILGAGIVGRNAAALACGMGAAVSLFDQNQEALLRAKKAHPKIKTCHNFTDQLTKADLVIGAVLIPGQQTPRLITKVMIGKMEPGSVFVDVAIDQGGCSETSKAMSHASPTYVESGVVHYCVPNMPGAFPKSATDALCAATLPYVLQIAEKGGRS